jgi:hypothetical protein
MQIRVHEIRDDVNVFEVLVVGIQDDVFDNNEVLMSPEMPQQL